MPKNQVSKCYFYSNDGLSYGLRHDTATTFPEYTGGMSNQVFLMALRRDGYYVAGSIHIRIFYRG